jgi:hypothetical protein
MAVASLNRFEQLCDRLPLVTARAISGFEFEGHSGNFDCQLPIANCQLPRVRLLLLRLR